MSSATATATATRARAPHLAEVHGPRPLAFRRLFGRRLTVNLLTDPGPLGFATEGVFEAFRECLAPLGEHPDLELRIDDERPADLLHQIGLGPALFYRGPRGGTRRICTVQLRGAENALPRLVQPLAHGYLRTLCDRADAVIATTPDGAQRLRTLGVLAPVRTLPGPISARFTPSAELRRLGRSLLGLQGDRPVVLGMGGLRRSDGVAEFAATARSLPEALFLWVSQEGGRAEAEGLDAFVANGPTNLRFAGAIPDTELPALFNAADVLLHTAPQDDRPWIALWAAACGLSIVLNERASPQLLRGAHLSASEAESYAAAVKRLLASPTERARWAALSRRAADAFRLEPVVEAVASLYDLAACGKLVHSAPELAATTNEILHWPL